MQEKRRKHLTFLVVPTKATVQGFDFHINKQRITSHHFESHTPFPLASLPIHGNFGSTPSLGANFFRSTGMGVIQFPYHKLLRGSQF